jgi:homoserine O-acetyltransferase
MRLWSDAAWQPEDSEIEVQHLPRGKLSVLETVYGHWGGGGRGSKEDDAYIDREVRAFLQG